MAENIDGRQIVALCGGGSSAHILIAMSGRLENVDVRAWVMESELEAFRNSDQLLCDVSAPDSKDSFECRGTATFDSDPANVIPGADVVIFCGPISVYPAWMKGIAPHVSADTVVGGLFLQGIHLPAMGKKLGFPESTTYFGFGLYPFASRIVEFGSHVKVLGAKTFVNVCTTGPRADDMIPFFRKLIATPMEFRRQPHFLACVLSTTNALTHPARMHGIYKDWDGPESTWTEKDLPLFYEEMDEYSATSLERLNEEALQVRDAIVSRHPEVDLSAVRSRLEVFQAYGDNVGDSTSLLTCYRTNLAYKRNHGACRANRRSRTSEVPGRPSILPGRHTVRPVRISVPGRSRKRLNAGDGQPDRMGAEDYGQGIPGRRKAGRQRRDRHPNLGLHTRRPDRSMRNLRTGMPLAFQRCCRQQALSESSEAADGYQ